MALRQSRRLLQQFQATKLLQLEEHIGVSTQQTRGIGGDKIPEFWGRKSEYTAGTDFLGTPTNHLESLKKRPVSPDVVGLDGKSAHYMFPLGALSSITNRATGTVLAVGFIGAGYLSLFGNLPGVVNSVASTSPILLFPFKFALAYTLFFHYGGAIRHYIWDHHTIGNQAEKNSLLEVDKVELSSKILFGVSGVLALFAAFM